MSKKKTDEHLYSVSSFPDDLFLDVKIDWDKYKDDQRKLRRKGWGEIKKLACRLFQHQEFDTKTWDHLIVWLCDELDKWEPQLWAYKTSEIVELLRVACGQKPPEAAGAGNTARQSKPDRPVRHPDKPGADRQNDILAAIQAEGTPLTRPELVAAMKLKTEGRLGHNLAWMVENGILVSIQHRGYWPANRPVPE